ncbi:hypothetical protein ABLN87_21870, partial [Ruegeria sp. SCPT10]|uniref:hypothetical protein n=1 Tax=Ruegeria sp. SCP10 TaxID=3141377 RepID=UPI003338BB82
GEPQPGLDILTDFPWDNPVLDDDALQLDAAPAADPQQTAEAANTIFSSATPGFALDRDQMGAPVLGNRPDVALSRKRARPDAHSIFAQITELGGKRLRHTKLSDTQQREIFVRNTQRYNQIEADGRRNTAAALAEEFKVSQSTINKIVKKLSKEQNTS